MNALLQHKKKLRTARADLAECEVDLVSYARVIANMIGHGFPPETRAPLVIGCRDKTARDRKRILAVIRKLERAA